MSSRCLIRAGAAAMLLAAPAQAAAPFRICAEPDNLPMSRRADASGYEIEVAKILAADMGRPLEVKWIAQRDPSYFRETLGKGACDALMDVPDGFGGTLADLDRLRTRMSFSVRLLDGAGAWVIVPLKIIRIEYTTTGPLTPGIGGAARSSPTVGLTLRAI